MPILGVVHGTKIGPNSPTVTSVTDVGVNREFDNGAVDVAFSLPAVNTAVSYKVTSSNGQVATGASSPIRVQNLPTGINTTFTVLGVNDITIEGPPSAISSGVVVTTVPFKPTMGVATAGNGEAFVVFSLLNSGGKQVISYVATGSPAGTANNTGSPITVPNLNNDVPHAFTVVAVNANGSSLASNPSNIVTPSTGGGGVPAGTFYCYSSDCFSQDGVNFAYLQAPIFTSVSPSDQTTLTNYSGGFGFARGTRVTYCNTVEATAAIGAQQSSCQVNYVAPTPPPPCDPTEYTSECGPYTTGPQVPGCSPTNADYGYTVTQTASKTRTIYDCNGIIISTTLIPCTITTFTATSTNYPACPGYRAQQTTTSSSGGTTNYEPPSSSGTPSSNQSSAAPAFSSPVGTLTRVEGSGYIDESDGPFAYYQTVDSNGNTKIYVLPEYTENGVPTPNRDYMSVNTDPVSVVTNPDNNNSGSDYPVADDGKYLGENNPGYGQGEGEPGSPDYEQPSTTEPTVDTTVPPDVDLGFDFWDFGGFCFVFGTKITMADGSFKNIEDLKIGDVLKTFKIPTLPDGDSPEAWSPKEVWSVEDTDDFEYATSVVAVHEAGPYNKCYKINNKIKVTHEHWILVKRDSVWQFMQVQDMRIGDYLLGENKEEVEVFNIEFLVGNISTVHLDVEDNDMYFADGILAHNFFSFK
jgi:hypothetical protein